ncbi:MAG: cofactor-independent phosphoglycerate mutase [Nitrospinae bacterium]|nr:cofactor-independent phosphoglycerate mutase [Nitrospinota bacterium]
MKYFILLADGMIDHPLPGLDGKTPMMVGKTPAMDKLVKESELGIIHTTPKGYGPGSDVCNLSILGYNPNECYSGRSPLEAASMKVDLKPDETAFRCNLVTLSPGEDDIFMQDYSAGHISTEEATELINSLQEQLGDEKVHFYPGISYRHLLVIKDADEGLSLVPPHDISGQGIRKYVKTDKNHEFLNALMNSCQMILSNHPVNAKRLSEGKHPANSPWFWGQGKAPSMQTLEEKYGISGAMISAVDLLKGIGVYAGMDVVEVEGATGYIDTNYAGKVEASLNSIKEKDLVFVHLEGADETGHEGNVEGKIKSVENFDQLIVAPIVEEMNKRGDDYKIMIVSDHATPLELKTHTDEPLPFMIWSSNNKKAAPVERFNEDVRTIKGIPVYEEGYKLMNHFLGRS